MNNISVRTYLITISILVQGLSATSVSATWYVHQSEAYYKPEQYHNEKYGDFVPADIQKKLFGHLITNNTKVEINTLSDNSPAASSNNQTVTPDNQKIMNQTRKITRQQYQQPANSRYKQNRNYTTPENRRYSRNANFNAPLNNMGPNFSGPRSSNGSSFSGPWNNSGSSLSMPSRNNRGSNLRPCANSSC